MLRFQVQFGARLLKVGDLSSLRLGHTESICLIESHLRLEFTESSNTECYPFTVLDSGLHSIWYSGFDAYSSPFLHPSGCWKTDSAGFRASVHPIDFWRNMSSALWPAMKTYEMEFSACMMQYLTQLLPVGWKFISAVGQLAGIKTLLACSKFGMVSCKSRSQCTKWCWIRTIRRLSIRE